QGSAYVRMFGASAMGKLHSPLADTTLVRAYRGEEDWRVRVNILNAFTRFPRMDSLILLTLQLATSNAVNDDPHAIQLGLVALDVVQHFVESGTLSSSDSVTLR